MMRSFFKSFIYAINGIKLSLKQRNMKFHVACATLVVCCGVFIEITSVEWCLIFMLIGLVISFEIINTAIELLVDFIEPNHHPVAGKIKDLAAGAVLFSSVIAIICAIFIFGKYLMVYLSSD